ncbi:MAG: hypothetical protein FWE57_09580 [Chitinispirillia bacterium]|nr:hypothetical protein [Chitinispirillia bacterium]
MESPRAYNYFNRFPEFELAAYLVSAPVLVTLWVFSLYYFYFSGAISLPLTKSAVYFTLFLIFMEIMYRNWRVSSQLKAIIIENERILKKNAYGVTGVFNFADIKEISTSKILCFKRQIVLKSSQNSMKFPLSVHGSRDMVERIFNNIKTDGELSAENSALKERLAEKSRRANIVQNLRVKQMETLIRVIGASAIFNCGAALIFWESTVLMILIWGFISMFFPLCAYFLTERIHLRNLFDGSNGKPKINFTKEYLFAGFCAVMANMIAAFFW